MRLGIPKEIKNGEHRVGMTPMGVAELVLLGHEVLVEQGAGIDSGFTNQHYQEAGAKMVASAAETWDVELVVKVKEPLPQEYDFFRPGLGLFTFLHLAGAPELAAVLQEKKVQAIAYETVTLDNGSLPLLAPMSQVAGRVAMLFAAHFLQKNCMGQLPGVGKLLGGIAGIPTGLVLIIGGGNVGRHAAEVALGLGAEVVVLDQSEACLSQLNNDFKGKLRTEINHPDLLQELLPQCDVLIGSALVAGEHAPQLLSRAMIKLMKVGSVFVDVAIDQGGMSETSRVSSYADPTYEEEGVIHCCLPNLPASVPQSSTLALTMATFPYVKILAERGLAEAVLSDPALAQGKNTWDGELCHAGVIKALQAAKG